MVWRACDGMVAVRVMVWRACDGMVGICDRVLADVKTKSRCALRRKHIGSALSISNMCECQFYLSRTIHTMECEKMEEASETTNTMNFIPTSDGYAQSPGQEPADHRPGMLLALCFEDLALFEEPHS